jgi:MoxR-like ATPase
MSLSDLRRKGADEGLTAIVAEMTGTRTSGSRISVSPAEVQVLRGEPNPTKRQQQANALLKQFASAPGDSAVVLSRLYWRLQAIAHSPAAVLQEARPIADDLKRKIDTLLSDVQSTSKTFVRTTPFARIGETSILIKDLLVIGAISHADVLLAGRTGSGKSRLAGLVMKGLLGTDGYYAKTVLPSMSPSDFMNIDYQKMTSLGSQAAKSATVALTRPGLVINEANRAPGMVQAILIPLLDREFELEGTPVDVGVTTSWGEQYQFRILTVNEGANYNVEPFDEALRDRAALQIPMDVFPQSEGDVYRMLEQQITATSPASPDEDRLQRTLDVHEQVRLVPLDDTVIPFLTYVWGLANCVRSPTGYKEGLVLVPARYCDGCHHATSFDGQNLCGHVRGPSPRALVNLLKVARGCALLRAMRTDATVMVTLEDVVAMAPFVLRGKLGLDRVWMENNGPKRGLDSPGWAGCEWVAVRDIIGQVRERFERFAGSDAYWIAESLARDEDVGPAAREHLRWHIENCDNGAGDNWCFNLKRLKDQS